jgi:fatty-acyl-CoA synthase
MTPAEVVVVPPGRLPRTTSGKLRRAEARRRHLAGELTADAANAVPGVPMLEGSPR